jgi:3-isopropylmalate/(R)-2-methylmalate dehydratase large subunit
VRIRLGDSILKAHAKPEFPQVGEAIEVEVDLMLCDDLATARAIELFAQMDGKTPVNMDKIVITNEHFTPPSTLDSAQIQNTIRLKAREWGLTHYHELGRSGVGPVVALAERLIKPGMLVVGTNPITGALGGLGCYATAIGAGDMAALWRKGFIHMLVPKTARILMKGIKPDSVDAVDIALTVLATVQDSHDFQSFEFEGDSALNLSVDERMEIAYLITESGMINAIIPPSANLYRQLDIPVETNEMHEESEMDFMNDFEIDLDSIKPMIAPSVGDSSILPVEDLAETPVDLVVIGGGMSGSYQNLQEIDTVFQGRKLSDNVRMVIYPASSNVYYQAVKNGIIERFINAGILVCAPGRGIEGYGNNGITTRGERVLINGSLNHEGIIGDIKTEVYVTGNKTCAASAIAGKVIKVSELD